MVATHIAAAINPATMGGGTLSSIAFMGCNDRPDA
jgi:hypothetical protein